MANMSYCRFRNTKTDLADCVGAMKDLAEALEWEPEAAENLSEDEEYAAFQMEALCEKFLAVRAQIRDILAAREDGGQ
ncbi:MAG: hypothetical protein EBS90_14000 [Betaproteobacteria bacterium]|nr:hypothetical protein [Betaproteobacteria bacterium]